MILVKKAAFAAIVNHALGALPCEACGLLGGRAEAGDKTIEKIYPLTNQDDSPEHFRWTPRSSSRR